MNLIHVVQSGDTLYSIGNEYGVDYRLIAENNQIPVNETLVVGQTLVIMKEDKKFRKIDVNGFVIPNIDISTLEYVLPNLTYLSIFSYKINADGTLNDIDDKNLIDIAKEYDVAPLMVVTNIVSRFDSDLINTVLNSDELQDRLIDNILVVLKEKGYMGINIDFEYVYPEDKEKYISFMKKLKEKLTDNYILSISLAPKTSSDQKGLLYEAHDYKAFGEIVDFVILMTYEWGYSGGPARAVAPVNLVSKVLDYAIGEINPNKILMGIPNYGYDWITPFEQGNLARSIDNYEAVNLARDNKQAISYDYDAENPYFNYMNSEKHEVWFEDARSIQAKLDLVIKYNLRGVSYWTINRFFPQNYLILDSMFEINKIPM